MSEHTRARDAILFLSTVKGVEATVSLAMPTEAEAGQLADSLAFNLEGTSERCDHPADQPAYYRVTSPGAAPSLTIEIGWWAK